MITAAVCVPTQPGMAVGLATHIINNSMLDGKTVRLNGTW
jgi:hypothetical protein